MDIRRLIINDRAYRLSPVETAETLQQRIVDLIASGPAFLTFVTDDDVRVEVLVQSSTSVLFETHAVIDVAAAPDTDLAHLDYDDLAWAV